MAKMGYGKILYRKTSHDMSWCIPKIQLMSMSLSTRIASSWKGLVIVAWKSKTCLQLPLGLQEVKHLCFGWPPDSANYCAFYSTRTKRAKVSTQTSNQRSKKHPKKKTSLNVESQKNKLVTANSGLDGIYAQIAAPGLFNPKRTDLEVEIRPILCGTENRRCVRNGKA